MDWEREGSVVFAVAVVSAVVLAGRFLLYRSGTNAARRPGATPRG